MKLDLKSAFFMECIFRVVFLYDSEFDMNVTSYNVRKILIF